MDSERRDQADAQPAESQRDEARRREFIKRLAKAAMIPAAVVAVNSSITPADAAH